MKKMISLAGIPALIIALPLLIYSAVNHRNFKHGGEPRVQIHRQPVNLRDHTVNGLDTSDAVSIHSGFIIINYEHNY
jgi:hypothetical protein